MYYTSISWESLIQLVILVPLVATAALWHNAIVPQAGGVPAYTRFFHKDPAYVNVVHPFGEMCTSVDPTKKEIKAKLTNRGQLCMMLGPATDHSPYWGTG